MPKYKVIEEITVSGFDLAPDSKLEMSEEDAKQFEGKVELIPAE